MNSEVVKNLLVVLAGAALINAAFAAMLWRSTRDPLFRSLFVAWGSVIPTALVQGAFASGDVGVTLAFATVFANNAAFTQLLAAVTEVSVPWRRLLIALAIGVAGSLVFMAAGAPFTVSALPTAIAVAAPSLLVGFHVIRLRWPTLHAQGRALVVSCMLFSAHNLDFAFLRNRESAALAGFTIAFLVVFAMSISAPAALLEVVSTRQARLSAQLEIARTLQARLAPADARLGNLEFACHMRQAESVGGDYIHHFRIGESEWFFAADVVGHGFHAGLLTFMAHSALTSVLESRPEVSPRELNLLVNRIVCRTLAELQDRRFMTLVSIRREGAGGRLVVSGRHEDLFVYRARSRTVETHPVSHFPLGIGFSPDLSLDQIGEATLDLAPGDILFVGTDGIYEAARMGRHELGMFGTEPVEALLATAGDQPLGEIRRRLLAQLETYTEGHYGDDVAFFMLRAHAEVGAA